MSPFHVPHLVTLAEHVSNIVLGVILTVNSGAQKHIILIKVKGAVPLSICAKHMFRHELDRKTLKAQVLSVPK